MDVAPWDKHWIKREFDGFGLYSMVFVEIQSGVEPDPCSLYFLARTTFVLVILARGQKSL